MLGVLTARPAGRRDVPARLDDQGAGAARSPPSAASRWPPSPTRTTSASSPTATPAGFLARRLGEPARPGGRRGDRGDGGRARRRVRLHRRPAARAWASSTGDQRPAVRARHRAGQPDGDHRHRRAGRGRRGAHRRADLDRAGAGAAVHAPRCSCGRTARRCLRGRPDRDDGGLRIAVRRAAARGRPGAVRGAVRARRRARRPGARAGAPCSCRGVNAAAPLRPVPWTARLGTGRPVTSTHELTAFRPGQSLVRTAAQRPGVREPGPASGWTVPCADHVARRRSLDPTSPSSPASPSSRLSRAARAVCRCSCLAMNDFHGRISRHAPVTTGRLLTTRAGGRVRQELVRRPPTTQVDRRRRRGERGLDGQATLQSTSRDRPAVPGRLALRRRGRPDQRLAVRSPACSRTSRPSRSSTRWGWTPPPSATTSSTGAPRSCAASRPPPTAPTPTTSPPARASPPASDGCFGDSGEHAFDGARLSLPGRQRRLQARPASRCSRRTRSSTPPAGKQDGADRRRHRRPRRPSCSPDGIADVEFIDEADAVNRYVRELRGAGHPGHRRPDATTGGGHHAGPPALDPNGCDGLTGPIIDINQRIDPAVDLIVSAHTHQAYNCLLAGAAAGEPRLVTQAGFYGRLVTDIRLTLDRRDR